MQSQSPRFSHNRWASLMLTLGVLFIAFKGASQPMKLLVILDDSAPLSVRYLSKGDVIGTGLNAAIGGLLPGAILATTISTRNKKYARQLQELIGDYGPRTPYLQEMLSGGFTQENDKLSLSFLNTSEAASYLSGRNPNYSNLNQDEHDFVMLIEETAGLTTPTGFLGQVAVSSTMEILIYDVSAKKRIFKQKFESFSPQKISVDSALTDPSYFNLNYPKLHHSGNRIYLRLSGQNVWHEMAKKYGLEAEFPSVTDVLKAYKKKFDFEPALPKGWVAIPSGNNYVYSNAPKKDKANVAVISSIDLLIQPLGQDSLTLEEYVALRVSRLESMDLTVQPLHEQLAMPELEKEWVMYQIENKNGGISIMLDRIDQAEYSINHQVVLLGDNYMDWFEKYRVQFADYINQSRLNLK